MRCADCGVPLERELRGGIPVHACTACGSLWILDTDFKNLRGSMDRFVRWLNPDLWSDMARHELGSGMRSCPGCGRKLHEVRYADSDIVIDICPACRGIWLHRGELDKIIRYLEGIVDSATVSDYLRSMGHETAELVRHRDNILDELQNLGILMRLLEYRVVSRLPALAALAAKLPPV
jgi:Zn-finger nucleic acid-binding protein